MTTDVELLPLTEYLYGREASDNERVVTVADAHSYAIRNVAHATAAKDAEIEALRTELLQVREAYQRRTQDMYAREDSIEALKAEAAAQRTRADAMAGEAIKHEARAERLRDLLDQLVGD